MKILLTGGLGFIGSHTAVEVLNAGHDVVIVDDLSNSKIGVLDKIKQITGKDVKLFRAPYGSYNNTMLELTNSMGIKTIQWDVDTLDWKGHRGSEICERVMSRVKNGSIILCHNNADNILDALPMMLERLLNAGYEIVSVGELIMHEDYYIDNLGVQRKN